MCYYTYCFRAKKHIITLLVAFGWMIVPKNVKASPDCEALNRALSQRSTHPHDLASFFEPPQPQKRSYRRARKLLFSQVAPRAQEGMIEALYTGRRVPAQRRAPTGYNCEHLWPRAWMHRGHPSFKLEEADLHNLFPSEIKVNARRGHLPFGLVKRSLYSEGSPSAIGHNAEGHEVVEVRDERKGDIARALFYMSVRWGMAFPQYQDIELLERWSQEDPPQENEMKRDAEIEKLQGNVNPFVHCPASIPILVRSLKTGEKASPSQDKISEMTGRHVYPWVESKGGAVSSADTLEARFPPPAGAQRVSVPHESFDAWLRGLPILPKGSPVMLFNGHYKARQDVHAGVIDIDIGKRDRQQCADATIRFRAEYLYSRRDQGASSIQFQYTTGDSIPFSRWARGERPRVKETSVKGRKKWVVSWQRGSQRGDDYSNFRAYLDNIFSYAGTASLSAELPRRLPAQIRAGDLYLQGGFPGHAILVLDLADHPRYGRLMLLAQSYMPAQSPHILLNPNDPHLSPWYRVPAQGQLLTPEWDFNAGDLYRFRGSDRK